MRLGAGVAGVALALGLAAGCEREGAWFRGRGESSSLMLRAQQMAGQGAVDEAIGLYARALDSDPGLAEAHLDLGILLHDHKTDYVRAIYHYQRYLDLRPDTQKGALVANRLRIARQTFAVSLTPGEKGPPSEQVDGGRQSAVRILELEKENEGLRKQITQLQGDLTQLRGTPSNGAAVAEGQPPAVGVKPAGSSRKPVKPVKPVTYKVQRGDTLSSLAARFYGDAGKWQLILDANGDKLGPDGRVREGLTLTIP